MLIISNSYSDAPNANMLLAKLSIMDCYHFQLFTLSTQHYYLVNRRVYIFIYIVNSSAAVYTGTDSPILCYFVNLQQCASV